MDLPWGGVYMGEACRTRSPLCRPLWFQLQPCPAAQNTGWQPSISLLLVSPTLLSPRTLPSDMRRPGVFRDFSPGGGSRSSP